MTNMFADTTPDYTAIAEKYKNDPEEMIKALAHSQTHIARLEQEARDKDQKLTQAMTVEELYAKLKDQSNVTPPSPTPTSVTPQSVLDDNTLEQKLKVMLTKQAEEDRMNSAKELVQATLLAKYQTPEKARAEMTLKAKELGMSAEALDTIALRSPSAFFKLLGLDEQRNGYNAAPTRGTVRLNGLAEAPQVDAHEKHRPTLQTNRDKYFSESVQQDIMNAAMKAAGIN